MKTAPALLLLLLSFGSTQAVSWADCCCGSFCRHKNECTGCGPKDKCPGGEQQHRKPSCCGGEESAPKKKCSHQEPSSEIDSVSADAIPATQDVPLDLEPLERIPLLLADARADAVDTGPPRAGPPDPGPLHLSLSVLRI